MKLLFFALALMFVTVSGAKAQDQAKVVSSCGTAHLTAGTQAFRTVDVNGVTCSGAGSVVATSVWSASDAAANGMTLSNGGLTVVSTTNGVYGSIRGSVSHASGKYYVEFLSPTGIVLASNNDGQIGIASASFVATDYLGTSNYSAGTFWLTSLSADQRVFSGSSGFTSNYGMASVQPMANDVFAIAIDLTAGKYWISSNNVWYGSGNPVTGANPMIVIAAPAAGLAYFPAISLHGSNGGTWTLQPTAASQKYAPPTGFSPWN